MTQRPVAASPALSAPCGGTPADFRFPAVPAFPSTAPAVFGEPATMSSREIAELTGKMHTHVLRDIRTMLEELQITESSFGSSYKDSTGRTLPEFRLPKDLTITLVSGYNVTMRHRIVTRWMELEAAQAPAPSFALPKTFAEALRLSADLQEANEKLVEEKVLLEQKTAVLTHVNSELAPKAAALEVISGDKGRSLTQFVRTLKGWPLRVCKMGRQTP